MKDVLQWLASWAALVAMVAGLLGLMGVAVHFMLRAWGLA